jgi:iron complex transport system permease protein
MTLVVFIFCVTVGSVNISPVDTFTVIANTVLNKPLPEGISGSIILFVRLPRVICVALVGVALSLCGAAMQGLLRNPLADGSTIGVSSGASLGAVLAIGLGITIPGIPGAGTMVMAMIFAFISLMLILSLAYKLDFTLSTYTIILIGVIYSMFASSIISFIVTFAGDKVKTIVFWTMGSLAGTGYSDVIILLVSLVIFGTAILANAEEMNAFAIGEDNARHVGVNVKRVKLVVMISISALIGVSVSIGGTIGFVGLVIPHITRMLVGPNHKRLLHAVLFSGAIFLMLADLLSRVILSPLELPLGVVTSFIGSIIFVYIFYISRKVR